MVRWRNERSHGATRLGIVAASMRTHSGVMSAMYLTCENISSIPLRLSYMVRRPLFLSILCKGQPVPDLIIIYIHFLIGSNTKLADRGKQKQLANQLVVS